MNYIKKLKLKLTSSTEIFKTIVPPCVIDYNFLSDLEIKKLVDSIFSLRDKWQPLGKNSKNDVIPTMMLPCGMYSRNYQDYQINVVNYRDIMYDNFFWIYGKIKISLEEYFKKNGEFKNTTHYPGFHIFYLQDLRSNGDYTNTNFHLDGFPFLEKLLPSSTIYSINIPLCLPKTGGHLLYKVEEGTINKFVYSTGSLNIWEGDLMHGIEPFHLDTNQYRISLQCHVSLLQDNFYIFW